MEFLILKLIIGTISLMTGAIGLLSALNRYRVSKKRKALLESQLSSKFIKQFGKSELSHHLKSYVIPHCSPSDPTNKEGEEYLADIREPIFNYIDRTIEKSGKSYQLLLADTGMGKTSFCLNYLAHARKKHPDINFALVSLASRACDTHMKSVPSKADTVLIADAFDEDPKGWGRGRERLSEILEICEDFKALIITCRSQYFIHDDAIPRETPLAVLVPRTLGQSQTFELIRSYISPFSPDEISKYINLQFPRIYFWKWTSRKKAIDLVKAIPDLAYRPMLLERLPDLIRKKITSNEVFDLYRNLLDGWIERESHWIEKSLLRQVSIELAIKMYQELRSRRGRLKPDEIEHIAASKFGENPDWRHLTSRSLLNRDSLGFFKFAHKSILEFLVVVSACDGDDRALSVEWTDFMKDVLVSWGHSKSGQAHADRAHQMLKSPGGRSNITPLYDPLDAAPVKGLPDFKRCAERRRTQNGFRIAPPEWRASAIEVRNTEGRGVIAIHDADYDLEWAYIPQNQQSYEIRDFRLVDILRFLNNHEIYRAPSYEQFISLIEGLHKASKDIIPNGTLFLIGDKPGKHEYLLAQLNSDIQESKYTKAIDKQRKISNTNIYVNCYRTGIAIEPSFSTNIIVGQLYIQKNNLYSLL